MGIRRLPGILAVGLLCFTGRIVPQDLPDGLDDAGFWELVTSISEEGGRFPGQYMSNEDSAQFVIPELEARIDPGGVYVGVGSEQNFTYIAAARPRLAFVVDIRRENLYQHLLYKALFELSADRAGFVSRVFSIPEPAGIPEAADVVTLFGAFAEHEVDPGFFEENLAQALDVLMGEHGFPLTVEERGMVRGVARAMADAGPDALQGFGDITNPSYAEMMAAADLDGNRRSYLASEGNFRVVQDLERRNRVVPLVGDFAGDHALVALGDYLRSRDAVVDVFYLSNVERYLFDAGEPGMQFYRNVEALPRAPDALFIRSVTSDISYRLGIPIPDQDVKWRTFLFSITDGLADFDAGKVGDYRALFEMGFADSVNR